MSDVVHQQHVREICAMVPVIPVLVIDDIDHAVPLGQALCDGGLRVLEITLRTAGALEAVRRLVDALPGATVGVGTLRSADDVARSVAAGAAFGVSPGATEAILDACETAGLPLLPGAATPSEMMRLAERGYVTQKLFPAEAVGGRALLKSVASPLPDIAFCPTGGITAQSAREYLALGNVLCVGGSWVAPPDALAARDWDRITRLARAAAALPPAGP